MGEIKRLSLKQREYLFSQRNPFMINRYSQPNNKFMLGKKHSKEAKIKMSNSGKGKHREPKTEEWKRKISEAKRKQWADKNSVYNTQAFKDKWVSAILNGLIKKPTRIEQKIIELLNKNNLPYKYVGNGDLIVHGKNPDFINTNGQKKIIEVFGDYWHNRGDIPFHRTELGTKIVYSKYGFQTLIIWESEFHNLTKVLERIKQFDGR